MSRLKRKLAKVIEQEMLDQHGLVVSVDPDNDFAIAQGFYRSSHFSSAYRWTGLTIEDGMSIGPVIDSYDTMTDCARYGVILVKDRRNPMHYEATARIKN